MTLTHGFYPWAEITNPSQNILIGFEQSGENNFQQDSFPLAVGDKIFLYTDGLIEAESDSKKQLGINGLVNILHATKDGKMHELVDSIIDKVARLEYNQVRDDIFLIGIKVLPAK